MDERSVFVSEVVRAGDVYLLKCLCPICGAKELSGYPVTKCSACAADLSGFPVDFDASGWRVLAGTKRKPRGSISKKTIQFLHRMQYGQCAYCDLTLEAYHVDHVVPLAAGGTNNASNLCLACPRCNLLAGSKFFSSIGAKKDYVLKRIKDRGR